MRAHFLRFQLAIAISLGFVLPGIALHVLIGSRVSAQQGAHKDRIVLKNDTLTRILSGDTITWYKLQKTGKVDTAVMLVQSDSVWVLKPLPRRKVAPQMATLLQFLVNEIREGERLMRKLP